MERLDRRRLLGSCGILLRPQALAALMVLHQRPDLTTGIALLTAIGGTAVLVWKLGEAVLRSNPTARGLCLVIGGLMALSCDLPRWPRATTFYILYCWLCICLPFRCCIYLLSTSASPWHGWLHGRPSYCACRYLVACASWRTDDTPRSGCRSLSRLLKYPSVERSSVFACA